MSLIAQILAGPQKEEYYFGFHYDQYLFRHHLSMNNGNEPSCSICGNTMEPVTDGDCQDFGLSETWINEWYCQDCGTIASKTIYQPCGEVA